MLNESIRRTKTCGRFSAWTWAGAGWLGCVADRHVLRVHLAEVPEVVLADLRTHPPHSVYPSVHARCGTHGTAVAGAAGLEAELALRVTEAACNGRCVNLTAQPQRKRGSTLCGAVLCARLCVCACVRVSVRACACLRRLCAHVCV
jgi:hypothetical protein